MLDFFGLEGIYSAFWGTGRIPADIGLMPPFEYQVYEETEDYLIYRNGQGMVVKEFKIKHSTLISQQYLDFGLKGRENWDSFRQEHLDPKAPGHYPDADTWAGIVEAARNRDFVLTLDGGSFYGHLRNWMGVEGISYAFYDDPEWLKEVTDYLADYYIQVLTRAVTDIPDIDCALFWEDMCYKNGPLCSPKQFEEFFLRPYQKVTSFLKEHGVKSFWVDCDGNIEQLIDLFIAGGVNGFYPLEVSAGMDPVALKRKYGKDILLWGGIDKRELSKGFEEIDRELSRIAPAVEMGGYIPLVDHGVPENISYENFAYYNRKRRERFNIKQLPVSDAAKKFY